MWEVMTSWVILYNMIVEDERVEDLLNEGGYFKVN
jgi:hypothetical protein